eukprot:GFUD01042575.1.p1 GENE.GFUD01042575.1~~GFUD01042575.1.p1  ORF type:complete len:623 (-),score=129.86 GFUD01042575.1:60-1928(-)
MELVNNNKKPITIIQYKYHEGEFGKLLNGAFQDFNKSEEKLTIFAKDKAITVQREPLVLFSPVLRSVLDSLSCCSKPALSLPDCSSTALEHLWRIVKFGATDFEGELNTSEIIVAAKCLQIDVTNFEYVKTEVSRVKGVQTNSKMEQTKLTLAECGESDSDLDENEVDDYGEEDDEMDVNMETDDALAGTKQNEEIESFLKLKTQMQSLLDDDVNDEQETLDEKVEDRSFTFDDESNDSNSSTGSNKGPKICLICNKKSRNLSFLWQHYCKSHFMKQLRTDCDQFVNSRELKCEICTEVMENKQDLYMHIGINHEKLNLILRKNGLNPLESILKETSTMEEKVAKFRIPKKTEQIYSQEALQAINNSYSSGPVGGPPTNAAQHQIAPLSDPQLSNPQLPSQNWSPALPVSSQPPFRHTNPPQHAPHQPHQPYHMQAQRAQPPPRYPAHYNQHVLPAPPTRHQSPQFSSQVPDQSMPIGQSMLPTQRPQQMGLWAQSAKPVPNPGPAEAGPPPNVPMSSMSRSMTKAALAPGTFPCQICEKTTPTVSTLSQHYARFHFFAELKSDYGAMADVVNKSCNDCGSHFKSVDALFLHIGTVHRKVIEIMEKKGMVALEVHNRTRKSM